MFYIDFILKSKKTLKFYWGLGIGDWGVGGWGWGGGGRPPPPQHPPPPPPHTNS